jgi:dolichol kinase
MVVIAIGILAMSYGDGFASIIGARFGKKKYNIFGDEKSYVGSLAMLVFTFITMIVALLYYDISITVYVLLVLLFISLVVSLVEGITPKGLDNLTVPFTAVFLYWIILIM